MGNHLGTYDAAIEAKLGDKKILIYHQHAFEDVSSLAGKNAPDGLWGLNYLFDSGKFKPWGLTLTRLTAEFLTTKSQSGSTFYIPGSTFQGQNNYFYHGQYSEGWSYFGRAIGAPFIAPHTELMDYPDETLLILEVPTAKIMEVQRPF